MLSVTFYRVQGALFGSRPPAPGEFATLSLERAMFIADWDADWSAQNGGAVIPVVWACTGGALRPTDEHEARRIGFDARSDLDEVIIVRVDSAVAIPFSVFEREFVRNALRLVRTGQWARLTLNMQYRLRGEKPR